MRTWLGVASLIGASLVLVACPGEPWRNRRGCPGYDRRFHWPQGSVDKPSVVSFLIDESITDNMDYAPLADQIRIAAEMWNDANRWNGSNVQFHEADASSQVKLVFAANGGTVCDLAHGDGHPMHTNVNPYRVSFSPGARCSWGPVFDREHSESLRSAYLKVALHEIGHTMGLRDIGGNIYGGHGDCRGTGHGKSVMDRFLCSEEHNVNDHLSKQSAVITPCDQNAVRLAYGDRSCEMVPGTLACVDQWCDQDPPSLRCIR